MSSFSQLLITELIEFNACKLKLLSKQYKKFIKPSELAKMLELASLGIDDIKGVKLNPIDLSFTFSAMTKINYFMTSTKK